MKKRYSEESKKKATWLAVGNLVLHVLLLGIIIQCVWMARMGVHSMAAAKDHLFFPYPGYEHLVQIAMNHYTAASILSPYVWPFIPIVCLVFMLNCFFSLKASRILKRGRVQ